MECMHRYIYCTPEGFSDISLRGNGKRLIGLEFVDDADDCSTEMSEELEEVCEWLDGYFAGKVPSFVPEYQFEELSEFTKEVLRIVAEIPYGETMTYGEIAQLLGGRRGTKMSAQAVGGAVGRNPISIIIPCHRVVGLNGRMTGYNGGMQNKLALLAHEHVLGFGSTIDGDNSSSNIAS